MTVIEALFAASIIVIIGGITFHQELLLKDMDDIDSELEWFMILVSYIGSIAIETGAIVGYIVAFRALKLAETSPMNAILVSFVIITIIHILLTALRFSGKFIETAKKLWDK